MSLRKPIQLGVLLIPLVITGSVALAQEQVQPVPTPDHSSHHGQPGQQTEQQPAGGSSMMGSMMGQGTMGPGMMQGGMGPGMMQGGMGPGMMQGGMMQGGMGALFGYRVMPMLNLSAEDVRGYLDAQLNRLNNKRLKLGDIKAEDGTITADIVTVDAKEKGPPEAGAIDVTDWCP
jgi:hypothetical protein